MRSLPSTAVWLLLPLLTVWSAAGGGGDAVAEDEPLPAPWFVNVAAERGLQGVRAKGVAFVDLNGDGRLDLCLDRERFYRAAPDGSFVPHLDHGIEFPMIRHVPVGGNGQPDEAKARDMAYVPHYLYFADVDNDGDADAVAGMHSWWEHFDGRAWHPVTACDPGVRSTVWLGDGKGRFKRGPVSEFSAPESFGPAMALALVDTDGDGLLDLYEGREYRQYGQLVGCGIDRLWRGNGKGGFTDRTKEAGLLTRPEPFTGTTLPADREALRFSRPTYGVTHADWNNDGHADLLQLAYGRQWNYHWRNNGDGTFTDVGLDTGFAGDAITDGRYPAFVGRPPEAPFRSNGNTFDCAIGDIDNDGDLDCFLGEIAHFWAGPASDLPSLLMNRGAEHGWAFERLTVREALPPRPFRSGDRWNYGDLHSAFFDADNDGRLDLLIGSGDYPDGQFLRLYRQKEDGSFDDATDLAGFDWEGCGGISLGDFDRDGDVDILAGRSFMRLSKEHRETYMSGLEEPLVGLFRNEVANRTGHHWLNVRLVGKGPGGTNRAGIGARVLVSAAGVTQMREIRAGSGLSNHQDAQEAAFGLGKATTIDRLEVRWADGKGTVQSFTKVPVDRFLEIREGAKRWKELPAR
ncbi:MAG: CRTAC1 family protein [Planctomycetota bacterium]|nr:CRTAC1 family protein [Planctomycetota bacterium]